MYTKFSVLSNQQMLLYLLEKRSSLVKKNMDIVFFL